MITQVDHLLLATPDLVQAEHDWQAAGFAVAGGGDHPGRGTANRIVVLDPEYLELISVRVPALARPALMTFLHAGAGAFNFALTSNAIDADYAALRDTLSLAPLYDGALVHPSGMRRGWRASAPAEQPGKRLPFLIQHDSSGEEKRRRLAAPDELQPHPNQAHGLDRIYVAVYTLEAGYASYGRAYGLHAGVEQPGPLPATRSLLIPLAAGAIELVAPGDLSSPLHTILETRGEGIYGFAVQANLPATSQIQGVFVRDVA